MKILIIEDDVSVRNMLIELLKDQYGINVAAAQDGEEGIEMMREFKPKLVITDFRMPKKNGIDVIRHIRLSKLKCHIIMTSADAHRIELVAKAAGADIIIQKPFSSAEIIEAINNFKNSPTS